MVIRLFNMKKSSKGHNEHARAESGEGNVTDEPSASRKRAMSSWLCCMVCYAQPSLKQQIHRHSRRRHHSHSIKQLQKCDINVNVSLSRHGNVSETSLAKYSTRDSIKATPCPVVLTGKQLSESTTALHLYVPMPDNESIRLLRIHKGAPSDPVEVSLEFSRLDDAIPAYEALSYVWGSSARVSSIIHRITEEAVPVTRNLYNALKGVRQPLEDRLIWVDALCINQKDSKEKGIQVRRMNSIYARASRVIVWLGADEGGDADGAFGVLCALANTKGASARYTTRSQHNVPSIPEVFMPSKGNYDLCRKVAMFFCQTWYTRLWVLQEIVLAQNAQFVWGDCSISWTFVGLAIEAIQQNPVMERLFETRNLQNACIMWRLSTVHSSQEKHTNARDNNLLSTEDRVFPFLHLLDMARSFEVTDPRDKIYGLLGFRGTEEGLSVSSIIPDYTLSANEVYTQVTRSLLEKEQNLNVLALVLHTPPGSPETSDRIDNLPSWVPDFSTGETAFPFSNVNIGHEYTAGFSRPIVLLPSTAPELLQLQGVPLDTVRALGPSVPYMDLCRTGPFFHALFKWFMEAGISLTTLTATMTAGRNKSGRLLTQQERDGYAMDIISSLKESGFSWPELSVDPGQSPGVGDGSEWRTTSWRFITYRQPFVTTSGRFGLGPRGMEVGDRVVVLWGGQCPFVAVKTEIGQWILKGECFVEGWMEGEAIAALVREKGIEDTVFEFV